MKIETHEVQPSDVTQMPEPVLKDVSAWIITAIDLQTRKPVLISAGKQKGYEVPYDSYEAAQRWANYAAQVTIGAKKFTRFAFIRIQKVEVV